MRLFPLVLLCLCANLTAADWFVALNGQATNPGTIEEPWDIVSGLINQTQVQPGDTVYIRGGEYQVPNYVNGDHGFQLQLKGTEQGRVTVRNYQDEHVVLDGGILADKANNYPTFVDLVGLEVTVRHHEEDFDLEDHRAQPHPHGGVILKFGEGIRLINCVIHHGMHQGIGYWEGLKGDCLIYGCVVYNNGWRNAGNSYNGHGIYGQCKDPDTRLVENCIFADQWSFHMQWYGSANAFIDNVTIKDVIAYADYERFGQAGHNRVLLGGTNGDSQRNFVVDGLYAHNSNLQLGWNRDVENATVKNNFLTLGNIAIYPGSTYMEENNFMWHEHYDGQTGEYTGELKHSGPENGAEIPPEPVVKLLPNTFEPNRAHLAVFAFQQQTEVTVDVSSWAAEGEVIRLYDPMKLFGQPLCTATVTDGSITVPMDDRCSTQSVFNAWVLFKSPSAVVIDIPQGATKVKLLFE